MKIVFYSAAAHDLAAEDIMKEKYGFVLPFNYSHSRKAAYQYGWDWGPRLVSAGIWKPIFVRAFDAA
jgi:beta-mannosidase